MKLTLAFAAGALAAPAMKELQKRVNLNDIQILNYALTLEHLENAFYRDGIAMFGEAGFTKAGYSIQFYKNLLEVSKDESTHVDFLTGAITGLGAKAVPECTYSFPYTDVNSFVAVANILEGVGVTAYLGAAKSIMSKQYLTYAGSVLTVESRHSSYLRGVGKPNRSPFPQAFDVPLDFNEVYSLASQFITGCPPGGPKLPLTAFPALEMVPADQPLVFHGSSFQVQSPDTNFTTGQIFGYFIYTTGPVRVPVLQTSKPNVLTVQAPGPGSGVSGQSYLVITNRPVVSDNTIQAGPAVIPIKTDYLPGPN